MTMFNIKRMTKNSHDITNFLNFWEESQFYMNNVSQRLPGVFEKINFKSNLTETKALSAEKTIDRLMQELEFNGKSEKANSDQPNTNDAAAVAQVVKVGEYRSFADYRFC